MAGRADVFRSGVNEEFLGPIALFGILSVDREKDVAVLDLSPFRF